MVTMAYDPLTALVVVDVQNDFADPAGSLSVAGGEAVVDVLNTHIDEAVSGGALVVYTQDWHPPSTPHFAKDGGIWPVHCVADTWGAALHPRLTVAGPVVHKGISGEEAAQMVARFDADVIEESPDLVLWQIGSNSVLRDHPTAGEVIRQGVARLKASGFEVILINPQYAPKILAKPDVDRAVDVITAIARDAEVGLFNRFMVMRNWVEGEKMSFDKFLSPDGLHLNDWSYACIAKLLATAILEGTRLPPAVAAPATIIR